MTQTRYVWVLEHDSDPDEEWAWQAELYSELRQGVFASQEAALAYATIEFAHRGDLRWETTGDYNQNMRARIRDERSVEAGMDGYSRDGLLTVTQYTVDDGS